MPDRADRQWTRGSWRRQACPGRSQQASPRLTLTGSCQSHPGRPGAVGHHALGECVHLQARVHPGELQQSTVGEPPSARSMCFPWPHHIERVLGLLEIVGVVSQQQRHACVRDDPQGAPLATSTSKPMVGAWFMRSTHSSTINLGTQGPSPAFGLSWTPGNYSMTLDQRLQGEVQREEGKSWAHSFHPAFSPREYP